MWNLLLLISSYFWLIWQRWTTLYRRGAQQYGLASLHRFSTVIRTLFFENSSSKILHEKTYENNQALHMGPQLYYTRVILALERNECLRKNKIDYILQRFRGGREACLAKAQQEAKPSQPSPQYFKYCCNVCADLTWLLTL